MDHHNHASKKPKLISTGASVTDPDISIKEESIRGSGPGADKDDNDYQDEGSSMRNRRSASEADEYAEYGYGGNGANRGAVMDDDDGAYPGEGGQGHPSMPLMGESSFIVHVEAVKRIVKRLS